MNLKLTNDYSITLVMEGAGEYRTLVVYSRFANAKDPEATQRRFQLTLNQENWTMVHAWLGAHNEKFRGDRKDRGHRRV